MDQGPGDSDYDPVVITGLGHELRDPRDGELKRPDSRRYLKIRKNRKFMGVQDELAVLAAGQALESAALSPEHLGERCGLYLSVGYIPFERDDLEGIYQGSHSAEGEFSFEAFSSSGMRSIHPLLTFRCLPNMPAFHISMNFNIQGPYLVTYPGPGQLYSALEEAKAALEAEEVTVALLVGVAHQQNFLVLHHFGRLDQPPAPNKLLDVAGCLVLERASAARARGGRILATLEDVELGYQSFEPFCESPKARELFNQEALQSEPGPASLALALSRREGYESGRLCHELWTRDGFHCASRWRWEAE